MNGLDSEYIDPDSTNPLIKSEFILPSLYN